MHLLACYLNYKMHGAMIKIISAQQAKRSNNCKNTRLKLLKTNAAIFNKMCTVKQPKPNYINVMINGQRPQDKGTTIIAIRFRINQEIKFLYCTYILYVHLLVCYLNHSVLLGVLYNMRKALTSVLLLPSISD